MVTNSNPLFDIDFLEQLVNNNEREIFVRITALDLQEKPIERIEGRVTDGSINIDGKSVVRRTCTLTLTAEDVNINEFYWGLKSKFQLEVGLKNEINFEYPDIIWFKEGIFVITQFNTTQATNKWTIKISGKDKMCLLNGEVSGHLPHETDFGKEEYRDLENDTVTYKEVPIKTIIRNVVQEFGRELPQNIIINDIDDAGLELLEYRNTKPAYLYKEIESNEFKNIILDSSVECYYKLKEKLTKDQYNAIPDKYSFLRKIYIQSEDEDFYYFNEIKASESWEYQEHIIKENVQDGQNIIAETWFKGALGDSFNITYDNLVDDIEFDEEPTLIRFKQGQYPDTRYVLAKIEYGDMPGYFLTDLTYAGDLIAKAGETLTSVLDKIKKMLNNFEYYYDINGKFIFQKKRDYVISPWNSIDNANSELYTNANINNSTIMFNFVDSKLISSFQNTPKINDLKNDYTVWGSYNSSGKEIPIHMRYAIDVKPTEYKPIRPLKEEIITTIITDIASDSIFYTNIKEPYEFPNTGEYIISKSEIEDNKILTLDNLILTSNGVVYKVIQVNEENYFCVKENQKVHITTEYKYYDAPELEPYNDNQLEKIEDVSIIKNGFSPSRVITKNGNEITQKKINLYFAKIPYKTEEQYIINYDTEHPLYEAYHGLFESQDSFGYKDFQQFLKITLADNLYKKLEKEKFFIKEVFHYAIDWRELIYQMALDYRKCHNDDNFLYYLAQANPQFLDGRTGYEQYYIDLEGFWRTLYDPNPELQYDLIPYNEVKKYTSLIDNAEENDKYDDIYIKNGYEYLTYERFRNQDISPSSLYLLTAPKGSQALKSIYSFIGSSECCLTLGERYYINKDNKMEMHLPHKDNDGKLQDIDELNKYPLNNIYIKNIQDFLVREPETHNGNYQQYTVANPNPDMLSENFKVPYYPANSGLNTYQDREEEDYFKVIDDKFKIAIEKGYQPEHYLVKKDGYTKLSQYKTNEFWSLFYTSNFKLFSYLSDNLLINLNKLEFGGSIDTKLQYLIDYIDAIKNYIIQMNQYNHEEILNTINDELYSILEYNISMIESFITSFLTPSEDMKYLICLTPIANFLKENLNKISKEGTSLEKIEKIKKIYNLFLNAITDIRNNYGQVSDIPSNLQNTSEVTVLKTILENWKITLINDPVRYENGQLQLTVIAINKILGQLINGNVDMNAIQQQITSSIVAPINQLEWILSYLNSTPKENDIPLLFSLKNKYLDFKTLVSKISNFDNLSTSSNPASLITYRKQDNSTSVIILPILYQQIIENSQQASIITQNYLVTTNDFQEHLITNTIDNFNNKIHNSSLKYEKIEYYRSYCNYNHDETVGNFWVLNAYKKPQILLFWFDFLNPEKNDLAKISVPTVGSRTKVVNDKNVKAIYYKDIPEVIFKRTSDKDYERKSGFTYILVNNNTESYFAISSKGKSAKERIDELLYDHGYVPENINISVIPVYYLEPNHRIFVHDSSSKIDGEYLINKITIPLSYKKTMTITATKAVSNII